MSSAAPGGSQPRPPPSPPRGGGGGVGGGNSAGGEGNSKPLPPPLLLPLPRCRCRRRPPPGPLPAPGTPLPGCPPGAGTDIFVTTRTDFRAQLRRCQRLLLAPGTAGGGTGGVGTGGAPRPRELRLHGLGLAVPRAINLALQLLAAAPAGTLRLQASTSSVPLLCQPRGAHPRRGGEGRGGEEEGEEEEEEEEEGSGQGATPPRLRHNSAIHIRVCREGT